MIANQIRIWLRYSCWSTCAVGFWILSLGAMPIQAADSKTRLAVLELSIGGGLQPDDGKTLTSFIRDAIVRSGKIEVMERQRMLDLLNEQKLSQAMCDDTKLLIKAGKILDVNQVLGGQVSKFGNVWTVSLHLVDVSTAQVRGSRAVPYEGRMEDLLTVAPMVALQLLGLSDAVIGQQVAALAGDGSKAWHTFRSEAMGLSVLMPGVVKEVPPAKPGDAYTAACELSPKEAYAVSLITDVLPLINSMGAEKTLKMMRDAMIQGTDDRTLRSEKPITLGAYPGLESIVDRPKENDVMIHHMYLVDNRAYFMMVLTPRGSENAAAIFKFLYSFQPLPVAKPAPTK